MRIEISNWKLENANITTKTHQVENSCQFVSTMFDRHVESKKQIEADVNELQRQKVLLEDKLDTIERNYLKLTDEIHELKARSMQENLLFFGLCDIRIGSENTENKLRQFLKNELDLEPPDDVVDSVVFNRVHRFGRRHGDGVRNPRPIVAKFEKFRDREKIRLAGIELNKKKSGFSVREQFPPETWEMEETRKRLYPVMRRYKQDTNNKVCLVRDKLYVNGFLYREDKMWFDQTKTSLRYIWATCVKGFERNILQW